MPPEIHAEVVYALPEKQYLRKVTLPENATVQQAIDASGLLTLRTEDAPYVHNVRRVQIEQLSPTFWRVVASYGWRETPNVEEVFHRCGLEGLSCRMMETSFFMSHESLIVGKRPWYLRLRGKLYLLLQRNALRAPDQFEIPPNRVIELGTQVEI